MQIEDGPNLLELVNEATFTPRSTDNVRSYNREYVLDVRGGSSRHGIVCRSMERVLGSAIVIAGGGCSGVHPRSMIARRRRCYIAVGDHVLCLKIPDFELIWKTKADPATVFGLYSLPNEDGLVVHGELEVSRLTMNGDLVWSKSGADIFSGAFTLTETHAEVEDFGNRRYRFRLADGAESA
jgi:hypothetical protein